MKFWKKENEILERGKGNCGRERKKLWKREDKIAEEGN